MVSYTHDKILSLIKKTFSQNDIIILAPQLKVERVTTGNFSKI